MPDSELLDTGTHPEIFCDGIGDVQFIGPNVRIAVYAWRKIGGILRRCIVVELIRPEENLLPAVRKLWRQRFANVSERERRIVN